jgi:hypothetical protein
MKAIWHRKRPGWKVWKWGEWRHRLDVLRLTIQRRECAKRFAPYVAMEAQYGQFIPVWNISDAGTLIEAMQHEQLRQQRASQASFAALCNKGCPR